MLWILWQFVSILSRDLFSVTAAKQSLHLKKLSLDLGVLPRKISIILQWAKIFRKRMSGLSSEPWGPLCPKFWTSNRIVVRLHLLKWPNMKEFCILTLFSLKILLLLILTFNKNKTRKFRDVRASKTFYSMSQSKATTNPRIGKDEQILMKIYV